MRLHNLAARLIVSALFATPAVGQEQGGHDQAPQPSKPMRPKAAMSSKRIIGLGLGALAILSGCGTRHDTAPDTSGPDQATALGGTASPHRDHAGHASGNRQAEVAQRGASVMPFDLDRTTHSFRALPTGGVQDVTSDDNDLQQIALIRSHLQREAAAFGRGDFASPASIHGPEMPGLSELADGHERIQVVYEEFPYGARLRFSTADRELADALHRWFAAQESDHGQHAAPQAPSKR